MNIYSSRMIKRRLIKMAQGQSGQLLLYLLVGLAVGTMIITITLKLAATNINVGNQDEQRTVQLYAADSQVTDALVWLQNATKAQFTDLQTNHNYDSQTPLFLYTVAKVINGEPTCTFLSYYGNSVYTITAVAGPNVVANSILASQPIPYTSVVSYAFVTTTTTGLFDNAITALNGNITLSNSSTVTSDLGNAANKGNIVADGNISLSNSSDVYGSATTASNTPPFTISTVNSSVISGTSHTNGSLNFPTIDTAGYETQSQAASGGGTSHQSSSYSSGGTINGNTTLQGNLTLSNSVNLTVNGNLLINGSLSISNSSSLTVNGALYTTGSISVSNSSALTVTAQLYDGSYFNSANSVQINFGGTSYINGYLTLSNSNSLSGQYTVVANGNISFNNSSTATAANTPLFIAEQGTITLANSISLSAYLYAPNGAVTLNNSSSVTGSIVGKSVSAANSNTVTFITSPRSGLPGGGGQAGVSPLTWNIGVA